MLKNTLLLLFLCSSFSLWAQNTKGLYVNGFNSIVGDALAEEELLLFCEHHGFNYLILYNLYFIHRENFSITENSNATPLAAFIRKARQRGIHQLAAVGETSNSFARISQYNNQVEADAKFDVYNLEFEFWNSNLVSSYYCPTYFPNSTCDTAAAFQYYINTLSEIRELAISDNVLTETYIGKPNRSQAQQIAQQVDRVLVHFYRTSDTYNNGNSIFNYLPERLANLSSPDKVLKVMPIFAGGPDFMGTWLAENSLASAFHAFMDGQNGYNPNTGAWKNNIFIDGQQWYNYSYLKEDLNFQSQTMEIPQDFTALPCCINRQLTIRKSERGEAKVILFDTEGHIVSERGDRNRRFVRLTTSQIPDGIYFIKIEEANSARYYQIVIRH